MVEKVSESEYDKRAGARLLMHPGTLLQIKRATEARRLIECCKLFLEIHREFESYLKSKTSSLKFGSGVVKLLKICYDPKHKYNLILKGIGTSAESIGVMKKKPFIKFVEETPTAPDAKHRNLFFRLVAHECTLTMAPVDDIDTETIKTCAFAVVNAMCLVAHPSISDAIGALRKIDEYDKKFGDYSGGRTGEYKYITEAPCRLNCSGGQIDFTGVCSVCRCMTCAKCMGKIPVNTSLHVCDSDNVSNVEFIAKTSQKCPGCGVSIHKSRDCNQMWCPCCNTAFNYMDGKIMLGKVHNPHYFEYIKKQKEMGNGANADRDFTPEEILASYIVSYGGGSPFLRRVANQLEGMTHADLNLNLSYKKNDFAYLSGTINIVDYKKALWNLFKETMYTSVVLWYIKSFYNDVVGNIVKDSTKTKKMTDAGVQDVIEMHLTILNSKSHILADSYETPPCFVKFDGTAANMFNIDNPQVI